MKKYFLFFLTLFLFIFPFHLQSEETNLSSAKTDLKKLISNRESIESLKQAFDIYSRLIPDSPQDYEMRIQAADAVYYLSNLLTEKSEKRKYLDVGIEWSKQAIELQSSRAGGHFFYGILTGLKAEVSGIIVGLKSKDIIRDEMLKVIHLDERYSDGDAHLALGKWYMAVPSIMGGSDKLAKEHLEKAIAISPQSSKAHLALAELYADDGEYEKSHEELNKVFAIQITPEIEFEASRDKQSAKVLLSKIERKLSAPTRGYQKERI